MNAGDAKLRMLGMSHDVHSPNDLSRSKGKERIARYVDQIEQQRSRGLYEGGYPGGNFAGFPDDDLFLGDDHDHHGQGGRDGYWSGGPGHQSSDRAMVPNNLGGMPFSEQHGAPSGMLPTAGIDGRQYQQHIAGPQVGPLEEPTYVRNMVSASDQGGSLNVMYHGPQSASDVSRHLRPSQKKNPRQPAAFLC